MYTLVMHRMGNRYSANTTRQLSVLGGMAASVFSMLFSVATLNRRRLILVASLLTLFFSAVAGGPAAHGWEDGTPSRPGIQSVQAAPGADLSHAGKGYVAACSGHCASHAAALPVVLAAASVQFTPNTAWNLTNDAVNHASPKSRLDRPPRA